MGVWEEQAYTRKDENGNLISLEDYEAQQPSLSWAKWMTWGDVKLYSICGVGFFVDSYDLFIVNLAAPIWQYEYWGGLPTNGKAAAGHFPALLQGAVKAAANIGNIIGQLSFGFMGDAFGRKFVYGKEMIVAIVGIIMTISLPNYLGAWGASWWLFGFRILMGIGIGGDYPMSAAIVAERTTLKNRGRMLAFVFSNQGWGNLAGSIVTLILLGCFSHALKQGKYGQLDAIWRLQIGLALIPCAATLYQRLTMPNSRKFDQSQELTAVKASSAVTSTSTLDDPAVAKAAALVAEKDISEMSDGERRTSVVEAHAVQPSSNDRFKAALVYFSEWRHLKVLIGTASTWFLVDVAFYGLNLNQSVILMDIGFSKGSNEYNTLLRNAYGNLIIAAAGYVPGYFITVALIEVLGRKWIQIQGFLVTALMFGIIAGDYNNLSTAAKFVLFAIAQLFFNFGPNATTFIVPAEAFPSRVRGFAHGFSAATGKLGAILASLLFNFLSQKTVIGLANVLWIFFALNILGAVMTFFFVPETKGIDADAIDYEEIKSRVRAA